MRLRHPRQERSVQDGKDNATGASRGRRGAVGPGRGSRRKCASGLGLKTAGDPCAPERSAPPESLPWRRVASRSTGCSDTTVLPCWLVLRQGRLRREAPPPVLRGCPPEVHDPGSLRLGRAHTATQPGHEREGPAASSLRPCPSGCPALGWVTLAQAAPHFSQANLPNRHQN